MTSRWILAAGAAALALGSAADAAIYVKIPDIDGETEARKDSGEAHLDYLKITLNTSQQNRTTPFETEDIGAKATGSSADGVETEDIGYQSSDAETTGDDDHSSGDEHEIEYDVLAGSFHGQSDDGHKEWIDVLSWGAAPAASTTGKRNVLRVRTRSTTVQSDAKPERSASGARASSHRWIEPVRAVETRPLAAGSAARVPVSTGAGTLTLKQPMEGCMVSSQYPYLLVGDDAAGAEVKLERVTVTECSAEHVSFAYEKVS